jgi:hypothetical protein
MIAKHGGRYSTKGGSHKNAKAVIEAGTGRHHRVPGYGPSMPA